MVDARPPIRVADLEGSTTEDSFVLDDADGAQPKIPRPDDGADLVDRHIAPKAPE